MKSLYVSWLSGDYRGAACSPRAARPRMVPGFRTSSIARSCSGLGSFDRSRSGRVPALFRASGFRRFEARRQDLSVSRVDHDFLEALLVGEPQVERVDEAALLDLDLRG